ncbi:hypothetical protein ACFLTJ_00075 [Chloroflexota bacterium]
MYHHGGHHGMSGARGHGCCGFPRHFISVKEEQERLANYAEQLKKELAGVEERIQELNSR